jgi:DNA-binding CsgD family transcriptional regulator
MPMPIGVSLPGFLLLDATFTPIAFNLEAIQILTYPTKRERMKQIPLFLADKVRASLVVRQNGDTSEFAKVYKSGNRRYICRAFRLECDDHGKNRLFTAVILERSLSGTTALTENSKEYDLTQREREAVALLLQGLTSKEIATRMSISPNTVKAFLRLVMVKMDVSTRSGIVGRIMTSRD